MRVKILVGDGNDQYRLMSLPVDSEVDSLAPEIRQAIVGLGMLKKVREFDLPKNDKDAADAIQRDGVFLYKIVTSISVKEVR